MKVKTAEAVECKTVEVPGAVGAKIRLLIHQADGAGNFYMRQFDIAPGGCTPRHEHPWEHEVFVLDGAGTAVSTDGDKVLAAGTCVFVPPGESHQFRAGEKGLKMLCIIPSSGK